ncbi:DUF3568 family protein [Candidatus Omnitrophota bacterium]
MQKTNVTFAIITLCCCLLFSGCIFIIAGVGALGGYAISKDTIQGETDKTFANTWNSSLDVLNIMGLVHTEYKSKGKMEAKVGSSDVKVTIEEVTANSTRLRVSARKYLLPDIGLAQKIYIKIIENAK